MVFLGGYKDYGTVSPARQDSTQKRQWCSWAGIRIMALGGPLPSLTHYGEAIPEHPGVITTTGHGGTCALVEMMVKDLLSRRCDLLDSYVALVGSGSIGSAIAGHLLYRLPRARLVIYDIDQVKLDGVYNNLRQNYRDRVSKAQGLGDLAIMAKIIISIATTPLSEELFQHAQEGAVIIDDSQPPSVSPDLARQLAQKGISVIWVVGKLPPGYSTCPMRTREVESKGSRYRIPWLYGSPPGLGEFTGGLVDNTTLWGCGLEGLALGLLLHQGEEEKVRKLAIRGPVTPEKVERIAALFERFGISIPATYQAFGHIVDIQFEAPFRDG